MINPRLYWGDSVPRRLAALRDWLGSWSMRMLLVCNNRSNPMLPRHECEVKMLDRVMVPVQMSMIDASSKCSYES